MGLMEGEAEAVINSGVAPFGEGQPAPFRIHMWRVAARWAETEARQYRVSSGLTVLNGCYPIKGNLCGQASGRLKPRQRYDAGDFVG